MKLNRTLLVLSITLFTAFGFQKAHADSYAGPLFGYGVESGTAANIDGGFSLGATAGLALTPELGVAVTYFHDFLKAGAFDVGVNQYFAELNFFSILFFPSGIHLGDVSTSVNGVSSSDFGAGLHTGFDVHIMDNMTAGLAAYWTFVTADNDKHSIFNIIVPVKFHF
jgi:hypothetical protein